MLLWTKVGRDNLYHVLASKLKQFRIETKFFANDELDKVSEFPTASKRIRMELLRFIAGKADMFREQDKMRADTELTAAAQR